MGKVVLALKKKCKKALRKSCWSFCENGAAILELGSENSEAKSYDANLKRAPQREITLVCDDVTEEPYLWASFV